MSLQYIEDFQSQQLASGDSASSVVVAQWVTQQLVVTSHLDGSLRVW